MADYNTIGSVTGSRAAEIDAGLRAHMNKVYSTMSLGMLITALASWAICWDGCYDRSSYFCRHYGKRNDADIFWSEYLHFCTQMGCDVCTFSDDICIRFGDAARISKCRTAILLLVCNANWRLA